MKKLLFLLAVLLTTALASSAQTAQVATLSHEGTISTFYSANALKDAYAAAVDGDVITLSSGTFSAPSKIEKNITLRGAGMMPDADPTILTGDIIVQCPDSETDYFTLEGVYHNGDTRLYGSKDAKIIKCWLKSLILSGNSPKINSNLMVIQTRAMAVSNGYYSDVMFINCMLSKLSFGSNGFAGSFTNCVMNGNNVFNTNNSYLKNCIITTDSTSSSWFPSSTTASYCYFIGKATDPFRYSPSTTNVVNNTLTAEDIFKDLVTYELKDEYAGSWLGEDGTQVGAHGGMLPFDPTPTNPQITKFNVSSKTTADGMLSVDIEVKTND